MGKGDKDTPSFEMTWNSTTSSGYCSQEESDPELELFYTARTSLFPRKTAARTQIQDEKPERQPQALSQRETEQKIKEYNSQIKSNLFMSLNKDGSYTGFIKVQLKLIRPVSVPVSKKPATIHEQRGRGKSQPVKRRTSFYLPKDASKHLHLSSRTPASEVIQALLRKFTVLDNPRKFALFQGTEKDGQVCLRKLSDDKEPLKLRLLAGPCEKTLTFVLKENETGEVNWDAFSMPELQNFLRILQREEEEHMRQIVQRYNRCRQQMQEALASHTPG
ncbi:ras association domain-containing protein 1 isoform 2-T2 [Pelodytes ibericus]